MARAHTIYRGNQHHRSKLREHNVRRILRAFLALPRHPSGRCMGSRAFFEVMAAEYDMSPTHIGKICYGLVWQKVYREMVPANDEEVAA